MLYVQLSLYIKRTFVASHTGIDTVEITIKTRKSLLQFVGSLIYFDLFCMFLTI